MTVERFRGEVGDKVLRDALREIGRLDDADHVDDADLVAVRKRVESVRSTGFAPSIVVGPLAVGLVWALQAWIDLSSLDAWIQFVVIVLPVGLLALFVGLVNDRVWPDARAITATADLLDQGLKESPNPARIARQCGIAESAMLARRPRFKTHVAREHVRACQAQIAYKIGNLELSVRHPEFQDWGHVRRIAAVALCRLRFDDWPAETPDNRGSGSLLAARARSASGDCEREAVSCRRRPELLDYEGWGNPERCGHPRGPVYFVVAAIQVAVTHH